MSHAPRYAELRCKSCFSFLEGASHPEELVGRAAELGLSALALADVNGLYGIVRAHAEAKRQGLPLIVGAELVVAGLAPGRPARLVLLAQDREGYAGLCRLVTRAHCGEGWTGAPERRERDAVAVPFEAVAAGARGLFALYPGADGDAVARLKDAFGRRAALAVTRHRVAGEEARVLAARSAGRRLGVPVAVTNDVHTHARARQVLQDVLTCVRHGTTVDRAGRRLFPNAERTLKGPEELARLWSDFPEGLAAAADIADQCRFRMEEIRGEHPLPPVVVERGALAGGVEVATSSPAQAAREGARTATPSLSLRASLPAERPAAPEPEGPAASAPEGPASSEPGEPGLAGAGGGTGAAAGTDRDGALAGMSLLRELVREGARWRYGGEPPEDVARQLARELDLVESLGYASYFLTVWDVVRFARSRGILCQGRGSAANSAVCYVLGITSIDPVRMGLLFERFISAERGEPPDIDVDFEHERREEVLQYVYQRYGRDRAGMVCEVITYRGKSALRDVGKALGLSLGQVDRLAKLIGTYEDLGQVGPELLAQAGLDAADSERVRMTLALARELQGFPRHLSIHVGGFVITRRPLCETVPIEPAAMPGRTIVQWDKDDLSELDLLKVDLLGLGMLTALSRALALLARHRPAPASPTAVPHPDALATIPAEDPEVYEMLGRADSIGVFQVESRAQMSLAPRLRPRNFYDLVISVAIIRPGPIQGGMIHPYLRRRDGKEQVRYPYAPLEPVLARTLGVPLFQEQAMRLAVIAAGFTPGEADELRRVMTHRRSHEKLAAMKARLVAGMAERGISGADAEEIFKQLLGFAGYGFPESHAASFALLVYASAWLKRYHPAAFACALLNSQPMGFYAPHTLVEDAKRHGVEVRGVDVGCSGWESSLEGAAPGRPAAPGETAVLRVGLHAVRGLPRAVGEAILEARAAGPFGSVAELVRRARLSRAWLVRLAEAGALGALAPDRRDAVWRSLAVEADGGDLFAGLAPPEPEVALPAASAADEVSADFATTGLSVRGHPMALVRPGLGGDRIRTARELGRLPDRAPVEVAGLVIVRQRPETARGIVFVSLEDETGIANLVVMPDVYERFRPVVRGAPFLLARGRVERSGKVVNVRVDSVAPLALAPSMGARARDFH
ncbi:DNA polymerase III, alpha subunit [Anaeromyxobacter dehalogenans 2CP-1]|uniref:Error-prone DNA polymerase n=1 Tax=Anaeromyxobacter dehalogenans (strain ATCC BAA-258 / DSM 21875 / 2CP-1) TaxID=455488 RepID=DNAE2_ANAD2|nr:error-prone DNA polymerase [Anaeromyxobacter dehalogenans]B8JAF5.1 RecName: Full=Error-prone DNA polymerase [Anaeromyxobacter dehalogenans 2CP-1]ACL65674.1 DNA polymerase III, alpha subunit [Anaeromyxobacter dehalogenans 2CP-1]